MYKRSRCGNKKETNAGSAKEGMRNQNKWIIEKKSARTKEKCGAEGVKKDERRRKNT